MSSPVLLSKALDPFLGVFTGVLAYYLYESNPRTAPPSPDLKLQELMKWKWTKWKRLREEKLSADDEGASVVAEILQSVDEKK